MSSLRLILSNRLYFAPAWVFASLNIMTGTWVLYLPYIKTKFGLDDSQIGIALFCTALGLLISIPLVPFVNSSIGVGKSTQFGIIGFAIAYNLPLIATSYTMLCATLILTGMYSGFTDISMNALVSTIEKAHSKPFMSAAHGFFSLGGFIGAGMGSLLMMLYDVPVWHMATMTAVIIISNLMLSSVYFKIEESEVIKTERTNFFNDIKPLLGLSIVAFIIMFNEGAVEHWSNLFLYDIVSVSESKAGLGFIAFSLCMTIGRFFGDSLSEKLGPINIILLGSSIAVLAFAMIVSSTLTSTVIGFGVLGLGLSVIIPELFRLAGNTKGVSASVGISIVSGIGFLGFLVGPVLLGMISNSADLITSFIFLGGLVVVSILLVYFRIRRIYSN